MEVLRDGNLASPWLADSSIPAPEQVLYGDDHVDVVVVGAGITGLTAALLLQKQGKQVLVIEAQRPGFGTTGGTSAHINTFADTTYHEAKHAFGEAGAQLFADAINEGHALIKELINQYQIDCGYAEKDGYLYAENDDQVKQLDESYSSMLEVGVVAAYTNDVPIPVNYKKALVLPGQAQFHPLKYTQGLQAVFEQAGGKLLGNTLVDKVSKADSGLLISAGEARFYASSVIYATHIPPKITSFSFRCAPYRSYVLGVQLKGNNHPDALVYDLQEPYHYFRTQEIEGQQILLVGGSDHKTGHDDPEKAFADLEKYVRDHYSVTEVKYRWSSQYYIPADGFPYIGQMPEAPDGVYTATGFNGNGMMLGTISAKILSDLILSGDSKYKNIFSPARIKPIAGFSEFVKENADVAYHFVADRFNIKDTDSLKRIPKGQGEVIELDGEKIAAYRDDAGELHCLSPVCTHAACIVGWNAEEKSWDCPCHGARFDINGQVLNGPADRPLNQLNI